MQIWDRLKARMPMGLQQRLFQAEILVAQLAPFWRS